jgi:hypothetical protein
MRDDKDIDIALLFAKLEVLDGAKSGGDSYEDLSSGYLSIVKESSWWGSRLFAGRKLKELSEEDSKYRIEMLKVLAKLYPGIRDFENDISSSDEIESFDTIQKLVSWGRVYIATFIDSFNHLLDVKSESRGPSTTDIPPTPGLGSTEKVTSNLPQKSTSEESEESGEAEGSGKETETTKQDADTLKRKLEQLMEEAVAIQMLLPAAFKINPPTDERRQELQSLSSELISDVAMGPAYFLEEIGVPAIEKKKRLQRVIDIYEIFKGLFSNLLTKHKTERINRLVPFLSGTAKNKSKEAAEFVEMQKIAHNVITRWVRRKLLGLSGDSSGPIRLKLTSAVKKVGDKFNVLMNLLESPKTSRIKLKNEIYKFNEDLIEIYKDLKNYLVIGFYSQDVEKRKEKKKQIFKRVDIRELERHINSIIEILAENSGNDAE